MFFRRFPCAHRRCPSSLSNVHHAKFVWLSVSPRPVNHVSRSSADFPAVGRRSITSRGLAEPNSEIVAMLKDNEKSVEQSLQAQGFVQKKVTLKSGENIGYLERGDSSAKHTLLCLHGLTMDAQTFVPFVTPLKLPGSVRVLIPDAMAHGSRIKHAISIGEKFCGYNARERAADVVAFLNAVGNIRGPVDAYGYSMGGATCMALAANHADMVNRVFTLAPACAFTENAMVETNQGYIRFNFHTIEETEAFLEIVGVHPDYWKFAAPLVAYQRASTGIDAPFWGKQWKGLLSTMGTEVTAQLEDCKQNAKMVAAAKKPVVVVQGGSDGVAHSAVPSTIKEAMSAAQCQVTILPGFGHFGHPTDPLSDFAAAAAAPIAASLAYHC